MEIVVKKIFIYLKIYCLQYSEIQLFLSLNHKFMKLIVQHRQKMKKIYYDAYSFIAIKIIN